METLFKPSQFDILIKTLNIYFNIFPSLRQV